MTFFVRTAAALTAATALAGAAALATAHGSAAAPHRHHHRFDAAELRRGELSIKGTPGDDRIAIRLAAGDPSVLQVDLGDDGTPDASFPVVDVARIHADAGPGDDTVRVDESNGRIFIPVNLNGGSGDDTLTTGSGVDRIDGGRGNDFVDAGRGNDSANLGPGDDTFLWNPGEGSDTVDGGPGDDTMTFNGGAVPQRIDLSASGPRLRLARNVGGVTMDTNGVEQVDVNASGGAILTVGDLTGAHVDGVDIDLGAADGVADQVTVDGTNRPDTISIAGANGSATIGGLSALVHVTGLEPANDALEVDSLDGNDTVDASGLAATTAKLTIDGGAGNDVLDGGAGNDTLIGGDGNDIADGNGGADIGQMGAGDDTFVWDPGDGSDTIEGDGGNDTMLFNGAAGAEQMEASAIGTHLHFFRTQGNVTMDTTGVENVTVKAGGGADTLTIDDLTGTDVQGVNLDLGASDGAADHVVVNGTAKADLIAISGGNGSAAVTGLAAAVNITSAEAVNDKLTVNGLAGNDTIDASGLAATSLQLELNGGDDADNLIGSAGADLVDGGKGNDVVSLGAGSDTFVWLPGEGSDTVDGQGGIDTMQFVGAGGAEQMDLSASGNRFHLFRTQGNVLMDTIGIERVVVAALGGADTLTVHDLTGTDVDQVDLDLGGADGAADQVFVDGTNGADNIAVSGGNGSATVAGLAATVDITGSEATSDSLEVDALDGNDTVDASGLAATTAKLTIDGGAGDDVLTGSAGDDVLIGGPGLDVLHGGPGNDTLIQ
jgi:Ca2+-binding RTX toxin-like protein